MYDAETREINQDLFPLFKPPEFYWLVTLSFLFPYQGKCQNFHINIFTVFSGVNILKIAGKNLGINEIIHNVDIGQMLFSVCADSPISQPWTMTGLGNNIKLAIFFK